MFNHHKYIHVKVADLIPYINNPRLHSDEQINLIASSIKEFGITAPVIIDGYGGIIAGHGRVMAMNKLGIEETPAIELIGLTKSQKKAYMIADNQIPLSSDWDFEKLKLEINLIEELDIDFDIDLLGLDDDFLNELLGKENKSGLTDEDDCPEPPEDPVTVLGDIWILGDHRLMCGDSTSIDEVQNLMGGIYPDLIHTDPPYGMNAVSKSGVLSANYKIDIMGDDSPDIAKKAFTLINNLYPESKQIWWGANYYSSSLPDSECWIVWDKNNGESDQTDCEVAWANFRSVVRQFTQASEKINRVHPTQKPVSLMEWIIKRFKLSSETIADFFGGSGSTLIAAEKNNIASYIMEFDPRFVDVIINRWQDFTGKEAVIEKTNQTYKEVAASRSN